MSAEKDAIAAIQGSVSTKINHETAKIDWRSLQRFFAAGKTVWVSPSLDLVAVATVLAADDRERLEAWMTTGEVCPVPDAQALEWYEADALVWSVVVRPWVLVQPVE